MIAPTIMSPMPLISDFFSTIKFKNQITWIIGALLFSGFISSVYGILQSVGWDFMKWSVDPTARVFASINNPVHYSAYIAMLIPPLITSLIYIIRDNKYDFSTLMVEKKSEIRGIGLIIVGAIISIGSMVYSFWIGLGIFFGITLGGAYYLFKNKEKLINLASPVIWALYIISISIFTFFYTANFISFGRGTWVGFSTALMFLYFFLFKLYNQKNIYISMVTMGLGILLANAIVVFKVQDFSSTGAIMVYGLVALFLLSEFLIHRNLKNLGAKLLILVYCANLQFSTVSLKAVVISLACIALLWFLFKKLQNIKINILTMSAFVFILFIPSSITILYEIRFDSQVKKLVKIEEKVGNRKLAADEIELIKQTLHAKLNAAGKITKRQNNILAKTKAYASHLQSGTARTSMWKSAIGLSVSNLRDPNFNAWVKEHPFLGTGPGTIKAFFPRYRRPDYGRLEGGHNFTPDKLHNEYVNTIATRGLLGFFVYYILLLPYCGYLFLKRIKENPDALSNYLTIGLMAGVMVYLGQVMFNFGVVATKAIYYELLGISMAIILNNPFGDYVNRSSE